MEPIRLPAAAGTNQRTPVNKPEVQIS